jgi:nucleotide-binding universal stress UspA family protein
VIAPKIESIFHPSDFSAASEIAFGHALKIALVAQAALHVLHVDGGRDVDWSDFPGVRDTLERWRMIPPDSPRSAVGELGIDVEKVIASSRSPLRACLDFIARHPTDLIVLAVRTSQGNAHWLEKQVGRPLAKQAGATTLFIPHGVEGFVSLQDGSISLRRVLVPVAEQPRAQPAVDVVARMIRNLGLPPGEATLLHAGDSACASAVRIPDDTGWTWTQTTRSGEPAQTILETAEALSADLIAMTTSGSQGFLAALRRGVSQRVVSQSRCPVLSTPAPAAAQGRR